MPHRDWKAAWEIFQRAADLTGSERDNYLSGILASNPGVHEDVMRLLVEDDDGAERSDSAAAQEPPTAIGPYRLIKIIAEGGMGTVYLAEQERPLRRKVALKQIRRGLHTNEVLARFEIERQALAILDHPNIARVFDAGTTPQGHPYFVMEFVDGLPINRYCEQKGMDVRDRLRLIQQVCEGVQHAHGKAIIHRDIKPANVLVTEQDGKPVPRIIDFGVAKAVGATSADETMATGFGSVVGTLRYMSPEQAIRSPDIDVRTDIYAIGVLLYELLTGTTPLALEGEDSVSLPEVLHRIAEGEPPPPSRRLRDSTSSHRLNRTLQGEVDWIVMKAIEKDRARRYQTANALARDIQRFLDGEAVDAGPPSRSYRLAKMAKRYRAWLVTAAIFVLVLAVATVVSINEAYRAIQAEQATVRQRDRALAAETGARAERDRALSAEARIRHEQAATLAEKSRADSEAATARAVADFLKNDLLAQASPNVQAGAARPPDPNLTVRTILDRSADALARKFQAQPAVRQSLEHTIAAAYFDLGLYPQAREHALQAVELRRKTLGPHHQDTLASTTLLAMAYRNEGKYPEAEKLWIGLYQYQRASLGEANPSTLKSMHSLAALYRSEGKNKEARALYEKVLQLRRRVLGPEDPETLRTANNLGYVYLFTDQNREAEALLTDTLKLRTKVLGAEHPDTLISMSNLALAYRHVGRDQDGLKLLEETLAIQRRTLGPEHTSTLSTVLNMGMALREMRKLSDSQRVYEQGLKVFRDAGNEKDQTSLTMMNNLGNVYMDSGQITRAVEIFNHSLALRRATVGNDHPETVRTMLNLGNAYRRLRKYDEAEPLIRQAMEARQRSLGINDANTLTAMARMADLYLDREKYSQAADLARQIWETRRVSGGEENPATVDALVQRARAATGMGQYAESAKWAGAALEARRRAKGDDDSGTIEAIEVLALNSLKAGQMKDAAESFGTSLAARRRTGRVPDLAIHQTVLSLASSLDQAGESDRAEKLRREIQTMARQDASEHSLVSPPSPRD